MLPLNHGLCVFQSLEKKQEQLSNAESVHARLHAQRVAHEDTERAINDMKLMKDYLPTLRVKQYALKKSKLNHIDRKLSEELKVCNSSSV